MKRDDFVSKPEKIEIFATDFPFGDLGWEKKMLKERKIAGNIRSSWCDKPGDVIEKAAGADALLVHHTPITAEVIDELDNLKVIGRYGAGYDVIDLEAATTAGIAVINDPTYCIEEVTSHALALMLTLIRRISALDRLIKEGEWQSKEGFRAAGDIHRLQGQKLGLIGLGRIGQRLAVKANALGLKILTWDRRAEEKLAKKSELRRIKPLSLWELLEQSDIISLHLPLTAKTEGLIGREEFEHMKKEAILINTARGSLIEEKALVKALQKEKIAGAGLDVFREEPLPENHSLLNLPVEIEKRIILTPHAAFYSEEAESELRRNIMDQVLTVLEGEKPPHLVNPRVW